MPLFVRQVIELAEARPLETLAAVIATILYLRLMMSGPRVY
jgi:hypothetical protein